MNIKQIPVNSAIFAAFYSIILILLWQFFLKGGFDGSASYSRAAEYFINHGTFESGYRPPLYPFMLAASILTFKTYWASAAVCVQMVLAVSCLLLTLFIVRRFTDNRIAQLVCAVLWIINIPLNLEFLSQRETALNIFLVLLSTVIFLECRGWIRVFILAISLALVHMTRPEGIVPAVYFGAVFLGWNGKSLSLKGSNIAQSVAAFAIFLVCISPWQIFLNKTSGKFNFGSSELFGVNLWKGNNPYFWDYYPRFEIDRTHGILVSEFNIPKEFSVEKLELFPAIAEEAKRYVKEDPIGFVARSAVKSVFFFSPIPIPLSTATMEKGQNGVILSDIKNINPMLILIYTVLSLIFFCGTILCFRVWRTMSDYQKQVSGIFIACLLLNVLVRSVFFYEWRFRFPLEPFLIVFCSYAFASRLNK